MSAQAAKRAIKNLPNSRNRWKEQVDKPLYDTLDYFSNTCLWCSHFSDSPVQHPTEQCGEDIPLDYENDLHTFRRRFDYPSSCCYGCGLHFGVSWSLFSDHISHLPHSRKRHNMATDLAGLIVPIQTSLTELYSFTGGMRKIAQHWTFVGSTPSLPYHHSSTGLRWSLTRRAWTGQCQATHGAATITTYC